MIYMIMDEYHGEDTDIPTVLQGPLVDLDKLNVEYHRLNPKESFIEWLKIVHGLFEPKMIVHTFKTRY